VVAALGAEPKRSKRLAAAAVVVTCTALKAQSSERAEKRMILSGCVCVCDTNTRWCADAADAADETV
jgi:hypothetical protein